MKKDEPGTNVAKELLLGLTLFMIVIACLAVIGVCAMAMASLYQRIMNPYC